MTLHPHRRDILRTTRSAPETRALGHSLARHLRPGDTLCLYGELGAGKTTFSQGLAEGHGVTDLVTSPSFTLIHEHPGAITLYHVDLYRLSAADLSDIGIEELIGSQAVVAIEWAEHLPSDLRRDALEIEIGFDERDDHARRIRLHAPSQRGVQILFGLTEKLDVGPRA